jgi:hypothetical protein
MIKRYLIFGAIILLGVGFYIITQISETSVTGNVVYPQKYRDIDLKFYDYSNKEQCIGILNLVPDEYIQGLRTIKVLPITAESAGHYYENNVLELFGCDWHSVNHELAHYRQKVMGDSSYEITHHLGRFDEFENEIFNEMYKANNNSIGYIDPSRFEIGK